jgi:TPR repeat protein
LGFFYSENKNHAEAERAFLRGYHLGSDLSLYFLGRVYLLMGRDQDAFNCFLNASEKGVRNGTFRLADCYIRGIGVEKNKTKGIDLLLSIS